MTAVRQLLMPKLGLTMTEGAVVEWQVAEGSPFVAGSTIVVVETDKVAYEIEAPQDGKLLRCLVPVGGIVPVGAALAEWESHGDSAASSSPSVDSTNPSVAMSAASALHQAATPGELLAAHRMTQAKQQIPHFYLTTEVDIGALQARRAQWNTNSRRPKLTLTHLFVAAIGRVLGKRPELNRVWDKDGYLVLPSIDVGIAVDTKQGLTVPVLRGVDKASLEEVARKVTELIERARASALTPQDVGGGAITVSNAGMFGVTYMGSIINPGQAAILAVGSERQNFRPDANGKPRLVSEIGVTLSCDHRILDGVRGLQLLNGARHLLESPEALFP